VNGTFVEGSAVVGAAAPLKSNQTVRFGTVSCLFLTRPPEGTEAQEEQAAADQADHGRVTGRSASGGWGARRSRRSAVFTS